jgi:hypothetical protein
MRRMSARQADACENAHSQVCRCRCGGACHGEGRLRDHAAVIEVAPPPPPRNPRARPGLRQDWEEVPLPFESVFDLYPVEDVVVAEGWL